MARQDFRFSVPKRVRMSEVDAMAIVFNGRYLDYVDIALSEYMRAVRGHVGFGAPILFARNTVSYRAPAGFDDLLDLCLRCARIGRTSLTFLYEFYQSGGDALVCDGESILVHLDDDRRPATVPEPLAAAFEGYEGRGLRG